MALAQLKLLLVSVTIVSHDGPVLVISMILWFSTVVKHWDAQSPEEPGQMNSSDEFIIFIVQDTTRKRKSLYIFIPFTNSMTGAE